MKEWKTIWKTRGFVTQGCLDEMYSHLPMLAVYLYEGLYPTIEYVDKDNWSDAVSDFDKPSCKYWVPCEAIDFQEE